MRSYIAAFSVLLFAALLGGVAEAQTCAPAACEQPSFDQPRVVVDGAAVPPRAEATGILKRSAGPSAVTPAAAMAGAALFALVLAGTTVRRWRALKESAAPAAVTPLALARDARARFAESPADTRSSVGQSSG
jgi:hypothetical protein